MTTIAHPELDGLERYKFGWADSDLAGESGTPWSGRPGVPSSSQGHGLARLGGQVERHLRDGDAAVALQGTAQVITEAAVQRPLPWPPHLDDV
jgi:hypothetical protein